MKKLNLKMKRSVPNEADGDLHFKLQRGIFFNGECMPFAYHAWALNARKKAF